MKFHLAIISVCAAAIGAGLVPGGAVSDTITASNGAVLPTPDIESLRCDELLDLMHQYSASGYRDIGRRPALGPDAELLDYEDALATEQYTRCHLGQGDFKDPSDTFSQGFN